MKSKMHLGLVCLLLVSQLVVAADAGQHWVATWGASPFGFISFGPPGAGPQPFNNQTLRQNLRISAGGSQVQIRFSNELGTTPLTIGEASIALAGADGAIVPASLRTLTFGGQDGIVIPAGAPALSDPVAMQVADLAELSISIYLPVESAPSSMHAGRTTYVSGAGNFTKATSMDAAELTASHFFLSAVYVATSESFPVVVTFGDSITDGTASTPHAYQSWPDQLAARAMGDSNNATRLALVNQGISGNQLISDGAGVSALTRFDRDVLSTPGLTHVVVMEGINDIGIGGLTFPGATGPSTEKTPAQLIAAYRQMIARAHASGVKIIGATLTPFDDAGGGYFTPAKDEVRLEVNQWIRNSGEFDAVIDFEAAVRDPQNPRIFNAEYNSGDNLHPGDAGYKAMADYVDLNIFR